MTLLPDDPQAFWDRHAKRDPLWAILSDPARSGRRWDLASFLETGRREISLLMYQLRALDIDVDRTAALDFGCGVGRLSLPLAQYFDRVVGVDISAEMIRLANEINPEPARVRYVWNDRDDLAALDSGAFTFMYSNVVLQHIEPSKAGPYLEELLRVVAPGGVLVFQLPSHPRPLEERRHITRPMMDEAYRASIGVLGDAPRVAEGGSDVALAVSVRNASNHRWDQSEAGSIRAGNHWRDREGAMMIQDDGRIGLPGILDAGETCRVILNATAPREAGEYQLEIDVVHEGISWFADKGSQT